MSYLCRLGALFSFFIFLLFWSGCKDRDSKNNGRGLAAIENKNSTKPTNLELSIPVSRDDDVEELLQAPLEPTLPPPLPPPSGSYIVPFITDGRNNDEGDDDENEPMPDGECGNGVQEALPNFNSSCRHIVYGSTTDGNDGDSQLVYFSTNTGQSFEIATITNIHRVSALDFSPDGQLYGVGENSNDESVLAKINCQTGLATVVGRTFIEDVSGSVVTDMSFDSNGTLWGYLSDNGQVGQINLDTGLFTLAPNPLGLINSLGNGLAFVPFPTDILYHADQNNLSSVDESTGVAMVLAPLVFPGFLTNTPRINGMDYDVFTGILYASLLDGGSGNNIPPPKISYLANLSVNTGGVSLVGSQEVPAITGLDAIAVNRRYEECDGEAGILDGAYCSEDCLLREGNCADGLDNDGDGYIDCLDEDCEARACDDGDLCTIDDTCTAGECIGMAKDCGDMNPCTIDTCDSQDGMCVNTFDESKTSYGSCEIDGHSCTVGKCVLVGNLAYCQEDDRSLLIDEQFGCKDENQCTADSCVEIPLGQSHNSSSEAKLAPSWGSTQNKDEDGNVILDNEPQCSKEVLEWSPCFVEDQCSPGVCLISEVINEESLPELQVACVANGQSDPQPYCPDIDLNPCTLETCIVGMGCQSNRLPDNTACSDQDPCTVNDVCHENPMDPSDFSCFGTPKVAIPIAMGGCSDDDLCTSESCIEGLCTTPIARQCFDVDNNVCTPETCDPGTGQCIAGTPMIGVCNDSDACTINDMCQVDPMDNNETRCFGEDKIKVSEDVGGGDDGNPCTMDMCSAGQITHTPLTGSFGPSCMTIFPPQTRCSIGAQACIDGELFPDDCDPIFALSIESDAAGTCGDGIDNDCDLLTDEFDPDCDALLVFITETAYSSFFAAPSPQIDACLGAGFPNDDPVLRADCLCNQEANADAAQKTFGKTFIAWLGTSSYAAQTRLSNPGNLAYRLTNDAVVVPVGSDALVNSAVDLNNPINAHADGITASMALPGAWTGQNADGTADVPSFPDFTCNDWFPFPAENTFNASYGSQNNVDAGWTRFATDICNIDIAFDGNRHHLYCFEVR